MFFSLSLGLSNLPNCLLLCLSVFLSIYIFFCLFSSLNLPHQVSVPLCLTVLFCLYLPLPLYLSISIALRLSLSLSLITSCCLSLSVSESVCLSMILSLSDLWLFISLCLKQCLSLPLEFSFPESVSLSSLWGPISFHVNVLGSQNIFTCPHILPPVFLQLYLCLSLSLCVPLPPRLSPTL